MEDVCGRPCGVILSLRTLIFKSQQADSSTEGSRMPVPPLKPRWRKGLARTALNMRSAQVAFLSVALTLAAPLA